jgi:hypothetical protein
MIYIKLFEDYSIITEEQILDCIKNKGSIKINIIEDFTGDTSGNWSPVSVENDIVTVEKDGKFYDVKIKNILKIIY